MTKKILYWIFDNGEFTSNVINIEELENGIVRFEALEYGDNDLVCDGITIYMPLIDLKIIAEKINEYFEKRKTINCENQEIRN